MSEAAEKKSASGVLKGIRKLPSFSILMVLIVMLTIMLIVSPPFRTMSNFLSVVRFFVPIAIAGIGVMMVIITCGIDLSIGSIYGFAGVAAALAMTKLGVPSIVGICIGLTASLLLGC
jgi:ribose/xylose/arabinose/galactoside ABC-type transport system permease subunit